MIKFWNNLPVGAASLDSVASFKRYLGWRVHDGGLVLAVFGIKFLWFGNFFSYLCFFIVGIVMLLKCGM